MQFLKGIDVDYRTRITSAAVLALSTCLFLAPGASAENMQVFEDGMDPAAMGPAAPNILKAGVKSNDYGTLVFDAAFQQYGLGGYDGLEIYVDSDESATT